MTRWGYIVALCVGLLVGGFCAMLWSGYMIKTEMGRMLDASLRSGILNAYAPLKLINDGKTNRAISFLEQSLDSAIVDAEIMNQHLKTPTNDQELIAKAKALLGERKRLQGAEPASFGDAQKTAPEN